MSVIAINQSLAELVSIHEALLEVSQRKTEVVKDGSVEKLQQILVEERKYIKILEQSEKKRQIKVEKWYSDHNLPLENMIITNMLEIITNIQENRELETTTIALTKAITKLKQQEQLNQDLIQQSMQFVQVSLDMLSPSIKNINYGKQKETQTPKRSMFDSKA